MDSDLLLVIGLMIAALSIPSIVAAFSDSRAPRAAAVGLVLGGALVLVAIVTKPGGYTASQIPNVFALVFARLLN
ncbi:MAG: hypothetical protein Q8Q63_15290 [Phaeovulum sp.]|uniref:hypothetical protein n=1 Tax=Phaeovulum sp. TaxID=2934796 RepID=UPI00273710E4|nr:hypothetical protein [Phaeovulum sp.]MDP3862938.1 hypothetical protein [Phaeovulum sp.]